jgi:hypothetical protein
MSIFRVCRTAAVPLLACCGAVPCAFAADAKPAKEAPLLLVEDFEETAAGKIPSAFTKTGSVAVVEDVAHSGHHALRMDAAVNGARRITIADPKLMAALGGEHWGRLYFKVQMPAPLPHGEGRFPVIHSTLVGGAAQSPLFKDAIEVRVLDAVMGPKGTYQYIYNVQPRKRPEFAVGSKYDYTYTDEWTLAEWHVDFATQAYQCFINGVEIPGAALAKGAGNFAGAEIPELFESLSFGWTNYQKAEPGFVAWIDDIALSKERVGTRGLPVEKKKRP